MDKYNTAIRTDKLDFELDVITRWLKNLNGKVINRGGKFLQFKDNEYQLVTMTSRILVDFKTFKEIHIDE